MNQSLNIYSMISRLRPLQKTYQGKIMVVAFLGTHIPLLTLLAYFIVVTSLDYYMAVRVIAIALVATLVGTAATVFTLYKLLAPIRETHSSLREYLSNRTLPTLPTEFIDEAGILMADTNHAVRKLDEVIDHLESYDKTTALPNRGLFTSRLNYALQNSRRTSKPVAVLCVGLDGFQKINNAFGQNVGDLLLKAVAQRLGACVRETDLLSRLGGDSFIVMQENIESVNDITTQAQRINKSLAQPFNIENEKIHLTASIGITVYPTDDNRADLLIGNADAAMSLAKQMGRDCFQFYSSDMNEKLRERLALENDLRDALEKREFVLYYQPQLDVKTQTIMGVEALIRWNHPARGFVSPGEFIPVVEDSGLIVPIGEWVLRTACAQLKDWEMQGLPPVRMAVNLSARQFRQPNLFEMVENILEETGIEPHLLELEITEGLLMENIDETIEVLGRLRKLGVFVSLDDFGTGYSSLSYLHRFPIHALKIDQSFVRRINHRSDGNGEIAATIINLARSLNLSVIAEGVETEEQFGFLKDRDCDYAQGFLFSRPVPAKEISELFKTSDKLEYALV